MGRATFDEGNQAEKIPSQGKREVKLSVTQIVTDIGRAPGHGGAAESLGIKAARDLPE